jgi:hypothetical protein
MVEGKGKPSDDVRSGAGPHEEFLELCAVSTSGSLSEEDQKKLREHLADCPECREAMRQFERVVDQTIPALAPELAKEPPEENPSFSQEAAKASFFKRLSEEKERSRSPIGDGEPWLSPLVVRRSRNSRRSFDRYHFWLPLAAGLVLCTALTILTYRMGKHSGVDVGRLEQASAPPGPAISEQALEVARRKLDAAEAQVAARDKAISEIRHEMAQQSNENIRLKALQSEQQAAVQTAEKGREELSLERDRNARQIAEGQEAFQASEKRLGVLDRERSEDVIHLASLEGRVAELSRELKDQQRATGEEQELLAKDRDIRELMGARDLYVAEVYDVLRTGETQKAFGRVFYTKGKSLIFYAYDLDGEPEWKKANSFQAWGAHGPDRTQAFNLGMFYEDNVSKKRWVLKFNDAQTLNQIDAVFVTVEPHGGSEKPSGKPLLYAYLRMNANHP